jgi:drug/metabolite transporter (DMT)-like permease
MATKRDYWIGVALTGLGAVILSPDALLFRLLDGGLWTSAFWRLLFLGIAVSAFLIVRRSRALAGDVRAMGWTLPAAALCMGLSNMGFLYSLTHTTVAETLTIIATAPVFAAIFATLLGDRPPARTWVAAATIAVGIGVIFGDSLGASALRGNLAALLVALSIAGYFTIGRVRTSVDLTPALALSAFASAALAAMLASTLAPPAGDWPLLLLLGFLVLPVSLTLISLGPKRLPAAEVGLLMLLETALGPLWVWLALNETPSLATFFGGALIIAALAAHSLAAWRSQRRLQS